MAAAEPTPKQQGDVDFLFTLGEMFTLPYAQLILEQADIDETDPDVIDQLFEVLVSDFSVHTTKLHCKTTATPAIGMLLRIAEKVVSMFAATLSRSSCCNWASLRSSEMSRRRTCWVRRVTSASRSLTRSMMAAADSATTAL